MSVGSGFFDDVRDVGRMRQHGDMARRQYRGLGLDLCRHVLFLLRIDHAVVARHDAAVGLASKMAPEVFGCAATRRAFSAGVKSWAKSSSMPFCERSRNPPGCGCS